MVREYEVNLNTGIRIAFIHDNLYPLFISQNQFTAVSIFLNNILLQTKVDFHQVSVILRVGIHSHCQYLTQPQGSLFQVFLGT